MPCDLPHVYVTCALSKILHVLYMTDPWFMHQIKCGINLIHVPTTYNSESPSILTLKGKAPRRPLCALLSRVGTE